jgi:S1-C subfamily serine protease
MKQKLFIILTFLMAGCSSDVFSQRQIPLFDSGQSYLGVQIRDITASEVGNLQLPGESGVFIVRVEEDSPAAQADLQEGDPPWRWPGRGGRWFQREPDQPRLGIQGERLTEQLGEFLGVPGRKGVLLMEVVKDSPAEQAGLKAGDVIISADGHPVQSVTDVTSYLKPGPIELEIIRDKQKQNITVELETRQRKRESMHL